MCSLCNDFVDGHFCIYMPCNINTRYNFNKYDNVMLKYQQFVETMTPCTFVYLEILIQRLIGGTIVVYITGCMVILATYYILIYTQSLKPFMNQENLLCGVDFIESRVDYSYCNSSNNSYSVIDHFIMSEYLFCNIVDTIVCNL